MRLGTSLAVQWLRLHTSNQGMRVRSVVRELRSHPQAVWCSQNFLKRRGRGKAMALQAWAGCILQIDMP